MYFETSSTSPYQIRRIEELNKTASGNVEAKVMCFYRRRDLPNPLIQLADKHQSEYSDLICVDGVLCRLRIWVFLQIGDYRTQSKKFKVKAGGRSVSSF